jgi:hypothetical protein
MEDSKIKVVVRKRPISTREIKSSEQDIIEVPSVSTVLVKETKCILQVGSRST